MNRSYRSPTQLHEDGPDYRGNDAGVMATLRTTPTASGWLQLNPNWNSRGDARHHDAAGNGAAPA
jgi:hypothetical protein